MAKGGEIPGLSAADGFSDAAAKVVVFRTQELIDHAANVLDVADIERVHDMRVATRRLRAALEVFEPCFPRKAHRRALRDVKRLADGLGERRDRDVAIAEMGAFNEQMPALDRKGVGSLIKTLRDEQAEANLALAPLVEEASLDSLRSRLAELAASARPDRGEES
jgi:CHAD domain-containing protein